MLLIQNQLLVFTVARLSVTESCGGRHSQYITYLLSLHVLSGPCWVGSEIGIGRAPRLGGASEQTKGPTYVRIKSKSKIELKELGNGAPQQRKQGYTR